MVRGGAADAAAAVPREREIGARLGPALREHGSLLVGIDVTDGDRTGINVTSPAGIRVMVRSDGFDVAARIPDARG
jgi:glutathione synthase